MPSAANSRWLPSAAPGCEAVSGQLMDRMERRVVGKRRASYRSEGLVRHDQRQAIRLMDKAAATKLSKNANDRPGVALL